MKYFLKKRTICIALYLFLSSLLFSFSVHAAEGDEEERGSRFEFRTDRLEEGTSTGSGSSRIDPTLFHPEYTELLEEATMRELQRQEENYATLFIVETRDSVEAFGAEGLFLSDEFREFSVVSANDQGVEEAQTIPFLLLILVAILFVIGGIFSYRLRRI